MTRKTIVITGASDGIGAAAARRLSADGHEVVLVGRSPEKTGALAAELGATSYTSDFADLDDLDLEKGYSPDHAYGNGKLENILFTRELDRRYSAQGIAAAAFHPGVVGTNFASDTTHPMRFLYHTPVIKNLFTISPERGARGLVWLATREPGRDWPSGEYFERNKVARSNPQARDAALARGLWDRSAELVGL